MAAHFKAHPLSASAPAKMSSSHRRASSIPHSLTLSGSCFHSLVVMVSEPCSAAATCLLRSLASCSSFSVSELSRSARLTSLSKSLSWLRVLMFFSPSSCLTTTFLRSYSARYTTPKAPDPIFTRVMSSDESNFCMVCFSSRSASSFRLRMWSSCRLRCSFTAWRKRVMSRSWATRPGKS